MTLRTAGRSLYSEGEDSRGVSGALVLPRTARGALGRLGAEPVPYPMDCFGFETRFLYILG